MRVVVITDGNDPTAISMADGAANLGHDSTVVDLRMDRIDLRVGMEPVISMHGMPLESDVVINRTGVNGLGLASGPALIRQRGRTWYELHSAAREEQGLLLAVFDAFSHSGTMVINAPVAAEMNLMRNLVVERLARHRVYVAGGAGGRTRYIVAGGRVVLLPDQSRPEDDVLRICRRVGEVAGFDLGWIEFSADAAGSHLADWNPHLDLDGIDQRWQLPIAESIVRTLIGDGGNREPESPSRPLITDMIDRLGDHPR